MEVGAGALAEIGFDGLGIAPAAQYDDAVLCDTGLAEKPSGGGDAERNGRAGYDRQGRGQDRGGEREDLREGGGD